MKGIILAGGTGSRLSPITSVTSKQLLPVYDKPLIYYPLSTLILAGIHEILIITKPEDAEQFKRLLSNGAKFGVDIQFEIQAKPAGIAEAFVIGEGFIGSSDVCLILGDNIFYGSGLGHQLSTVDASQSASIFAFPVSDPERYGVVEFSPDGTVVSLEEKPDIPKSQYAVPGIYFYPNNVVDISKKLTPSGRGELEITDVNRYYLEQGLLKCLKLSRGTVWFDTGTFDSLNDASNFIRITEARQGMKIGCPEEVSLQSGRLTVNDLREQIMTMPSNEYRHYLEALIEQFSSNMVRNRA